MQYEPIEVDLEAGEMYFWCTCGASGQQPFCDGSHKLKAPGAKSLKVVPERSEKVWLCTCKRTKNPPYCDGSHN